MFALRVVGYEMGNHPTSYRCSCTAVVLHTTNNHILYISQVVLASIHRPGSGSYRCSTHDIASRDHRVERTVRHAENREQTARCSPVSRIVLPNSCLTEVPDELWCFGSVAQKRL